MKKIKDAVSFVWNLVNGYKTYIVAVAAVIWGVHSGSAELVITGLGLAGLRHGVSKEEDTLLALIESLLAAKSAKKK